MSNTPTNSDDSLSSETQKAESNKTEPKKSSVGEVVLSPHDRLLTRLLAHLEPARRLILTYLPSELIAVVKPETLKQVDTSFIDSHLRRRFVDRLFSLELSDEYCGRAEPRSSQLHLLILIEHKSVSEKSAVLKILGYMVRIWENQLDNGIPLEPIFPWLLYNGVHPWSAPKSLQELLSISEAWKLHLPQLDLPILDICRMDFSDADDEPILLATFQLLKYGRDTDVLEKIRPAVARLAEALDEEHAKNWQDTIRKYVMSVNPVTDEKKLTELYEDFWPVEHEPGSIADQLLTKGRLEGEAKGRLEGEANGLTLGEQRGQIAGEIKLIETLKLILGISSTTDDLSTKSLSELRQISETLQGRVLSERNR